MSTCQSRTQEMGTPVCEDSLDSCPLPSTDPTPDPLPSSPSHDSDIGWPIALRKGIRSTRNPHPIYLSYHRLSPSYFSFVSSVSSITIPKSACEALNHPGWQQAMIVKMQALEQSDTWELVPLPLGKKVVGCTWVFAIKVAPNDTIDCLKARLVAKGYTQVYGLGMEILSLLAKITTIRLLLAMVVIHHWPLHQLDIKNAFLHGDLDEEIYMDQVVQNFTMTRSEAYHSIFYCHSSSGKCVYLVVYMDDIVITRNDDIKISHLKQLVDSPMDPNMKLMVKQDEPYSDPERYRRLVGKLIYLTITRPDISFVVEVVSQFMQAPFALIIGQQSSVFLDISRRHLDRF
ncbi:hypothetical protein CR513_34277, partial [Mucuna pruriens]